MRWLLKVEPLLKDPLTWPVLALIVLLVAAAIRFAYECRNSI